MSVAEYFSVSFKNLFTNFAISMFFFTQACSAISLVKSPIESAFVTNLTDAIATKSSALRFASYLQPVEVQTGSYYPFGGHLNINMPENRETFNIVKDFLY